GGTAASTVMAVINALSVRGLEVSRRLLVLLKARSQPSNGAIARGVFRACPLFSGRRQRAAQDFARGLGAVDQPQRAALDLPSGGGAHEIPAVGDYPMNVIAARGAVLGNRDRLAGFFRSKDLQIGNNYGGIAVNRDMRQSREMRQPAGNGCLMLGALQLRGHRLVADRACETRTAVEDSIWGKDRLGIVSRAGICAGWMAGDEIVDFKPVFDGANALFQQQVFFSHDRFPSIVIPTFDRLN